MHLRAGWSEEDFFDVYLVGISCRTLWMVVLGGDSIADELMNMASSSTPWAPDLLRGKERIWWNRSLQFIFERNWIERETKSKMCGIHVRLVCTEAQ